MDIEAPDQPGYVAKKVATISMVKPEANARLIAAAPDLLEALNNCLKWMESMRASGDSGNWEWKEDEYTKGVAVLAKATGEA
jgi:hypothetical protein